ncbi:MAG TPA: hypothetical protein VM145_03915 [Sphingomicrobium sp.]|nr:hypothetical protein [Sphingomicrobium sp.]
MKRLAFAFAGAASLILVGCDSNNQDQVDNAELNQPSTDELNEQANEAAMDAANAESAALGQQQQQLETTDNTVDTSDAQEQNVSGM